ncbi:uncharacterized protein AC631_03171 [Debaryomyces fabryi]|uniref:Protein PET117, mitochondrial n=1 Tax=Debaryomyces fabryi TaxID=58627 RepID=A0A0V1PXR8_9ASCO|nr:uncharacterized protein AC631_03171 [Debaryomyces fabryi]KSA01047.1 hypothetical protein AC631_03171 [Debaryomyces fabryi]CUM47615.1 unnamed protein product [Debaryomyces fabryi]
MSTASKITFGSSCLLAVGTFLGINYLQRSERESLRQGPIKDAERIAAKELSKKQKVNDMEHREQMMLQEKFSSVQPLNNEIIRADEEQE